MAYKQKGSPLNKHITEDHKMAYDRAEIYRLKGDIHSDDMSKKGGPPAKSKYLSEGGDVIDETAQKSALSFMSKHSNSALNFGHDKLLAEKREVASKDIMSQPTPNSDWLRDGGPVIDETAQGPTKVNKPWLRKQGGEGTGAGNFLRTLKTKIFGNRDVTKEITKRDGKKEKTKTVTTTGGIF